MWHRSKWRAGGSSVVVNYGFMSRSRDAIPRSLSALWSLPVDVLRRNFDVAGLAVDAAVANH